MIEQNYLTQLSWTRKQKLILDWNFDRLYQKFHNRIYNSPNNYHAVVAWHINDILVCSKYVVCTKFGMWYKPCWLLFIVCWIRSFLVCSKYVVWHGAKKPTNRMKWPKFTKFRGRIHRKQNFKTFIKSKASTASWLCNSLPFIIINRSLHTQHTK